jgi:hypothetical protein
MRAFHIARHGATADELAELLVLLSHGQAHDSLLDDKGRTCLMRASASGHHSGASSLQSWSGCVRRTQRNWLGRALLCIVVDVVRVLLSIEDDEVRERLLFMQDAEKETALHAACYNAHEAVCALLVEGAGLRRRDLLAVDNCRGKTAADICQRMACLK